MPSKGPAKRSSQSKPFDLTGYLADCTRQVDQALNRLLPSEETVPPTIHRAMRYSVFAGGKRLRPALCVAAAEASGGSIKKALPLACAVECIHTYSLIHDDLPAMDNDDFRRGQPTNHKAFGEAVAILAGDALLTQAFEIAAQAPKTTRYGCEDFILELSRAAGSKQLVAGQIADLESEQREISEDDLRFIHERKTSALLTCAVRLGGMSANCSPTRLRALTRFGKSVGLAFQVVDDILDVTQSSEQLGKTGGKDVAAQKATYPTIVGLERSREIAEELTRNAFEAVRPFGAQAKALESLARYLVTRDR